MRLTTIVTCENDLPTSVEVFTNSSAIDAYLLKHFKDVWAETDATGDMPETWQEIRDELDAQTRLADRDKPHVGVHEVDVCAFG